MLQQAPHVTDKAGQMGNWELLGWKDNLRAPAQLSCFQIVDKDGFSHNILQSISMVLLEKRQERQEVCFLFLALPLVHYLITASP